MEQTKILGVKVNKAGTEEVIEKIKNFLLSGQQHYIVTLNPEMIVETKKNNYFKKIINEANIVVPDGVGIILANKFLNHEILPEKITGIDLIYKICESDFIKNKKIYLLGAGKGIAEEAAKVLSEKYSYLNVAGSEEGIPAEIFNSQFSIFNKFSISNFKRNPKFNLLNLFHNLFIKIHLLTEKSRDELETTDYIYKNDNNSLIQRINKAQPDIIFVAFGAPKQEKWIYENLKKIPSVKLAIGVGGSFDFISGKIKRAPLVFQKIGLEWLWRLILEPRRIRRIYNATIKFGWMVLVRSYKNFNKF